MNLVPGTDLTAEQLAQVRGIFVRKASPAWIAAHRFWVRDGAVLPRAARHVNEPAAGWKRPPALSPEERQRRADQRDRGVLNDGSEGS